MSYCPDCGVDHHAGEREETAALDREVEMERLRTKRDVEVARIQAGAVKDVTETEVDAEVEVAAIEAEAGVEAAEAVAYVLEEVVSPPEPEAAPVVVVDAPAEPAAPEGGEEAEPPPVHEPRGNSSYGNSGWFAGR